jgi:hypothetical protein
MSRRTSVACVLAVLALVSAAAADSLVLQLTLEGTLSQSGDQFSITVEGEGTWALELNAWQQAEARRIRDSGRYPKVAVTGNARARTSGNALQLVDRTIRVQTLDPLFPVVKVTRIAPLTPAEGRLQVGDLIREVGEEKITSFNHLLRVLGKHRGKMVDVVVHRQGRSQVIPKVPLQTGSVLLGITGEMAWQRGEGLPAEAAKDVEMPLKSPEKD